MKNKKAQNIDLYIKFTILNYLKNFMNSKIINNNHHKKYTYDEVPAVQYK